MLLETLILMEVMGFLFLALGILPFKRDEENLPLINKVIFCFVAAIIFGMLSFTSISYDYNYCWVNETISDYSSNTSISTATCDSYEIQNIGLSYFNMGLTSISIILVIIFVLFASLDFKNQKMRGFEGNL